MAGLLDDILGYGRDVAQGASNSIAGNVSAPVDGLAWLLRKAGIPEAYIFKNSPVRDANKAAFNASNAAQDNVYGKTSLPFLGALGGTALGADYLLRKD